jgi:hypothetical protein
MALRYQHIMARYIPIMRAYAQTPSPSLRATIKNVVTKGSGIEPRKLESGFNAHKRIWIVLLSLAFIRQLAAQSEIDVELVEVFTDVRASWTSCIALILKRQPHRAATTRGQTYS